MKKLLLLPLVPVLLACRPVGRNYERPRPAVPDGYAMAAGTAKVAADWWTSLGDPQLDALVKRALAESPDLLAAEARLRQARALQGVQEAQGGPNLNLSARESRDKLSRNGEMFANIPFPNPKTDFTNYQAGFDASWELDFFGHQRRLSEAAAARTGAAAERLQDARLILAADVARNYIELRAWQQRLVLAGETVRTLDEQLRLARIAQGAGETSLQDLRQTELARSNYQALLPALEVGLRQNLTALAALTSQPVQTLTTQLGPGQALMPVPPVPEAGVPSDLLVRRPDLRAAERDLAAASGDAAVAVSNLYPRFSLVGQAGWNSIQSGTLLSSASRMWSLGPQLSLPLFNPGLRGQAKAGAAGYDAALAGYHKAVLAALADVDVAFTRMARNEDKRQSLLAAEVEAKQLFGFSQLQLKAGEVSKVAVLQARRALLEQQDQLLQAQGQSLTALVSVYKALGGGWGK
jgi:NodT family efflux transporter outer membrane factor (OMF) lipoprotein